jgi:UDP:flavonoid glycosyltransferase YjiC (YdhE family)
MRAVLTNFGTTGDVLPLLALGHQLRVGGHDVVVACPPSHRAVVTGHGFPFVAVGPDLHDVQAHVNQQWAEEPADGASADDMRALLAPLAAALPESYDVIRALAGRADVLVSGPAQPAARMVHETTAIPFASVQFSNFGGAGTPALQAATAALINPFREKLGLRALPNPVTRDANSPQLALYAMSRHLVPETAAWPRHRRVVGFFFLRQPDWTPDEPLRRFVEAGEPPVVVSFGSMPHRDPERLARGIHDACALAGVRAVWQAGDGLDAAAGSELVHVSGFVPHDWLFPRASCIIHHGGSGTAAAVFRAGKPSVYVPHGAIFDQTYWARLSAEHGCSPEAVPIQTLTATRLAAAIRECRDREDRRRAAARLGEQVRAEAGVKAARQHIEALVRDVGLD